MFTAHIKPNLIQLQQSDSMVRIFSILETLEGLQWSPGNSQRRSWPGLSRCWKLLNLGLTLLMYANTFLSKNRGSQVPYWGARDGFQLLNAWNRRHLVPEGQKVLYTRSIPCFSRRIWSVEIVLQFASKEYCLGLRLRKMTIRRSYKIVRW